MGAAQSPDALGVALVAMPDDEFSSTWPRLDDAVRQRLPQATRQRCIDRYRRLTPWYAQTIARLTRQAPAGAGVSLPRFSVLSAADVMNAPPLQWLVRGVLPATGLACIYGASTSGKSFLALDMSAAIAAGAAWFDCRVKAAPVVYVALEGEAGFSQRVQAWRLHHEQDLPPALRFIMQGFDLRDAGDVADIAAAVNASGCAGGVLVIDTLNRAASGADENTSRDMGELIDACKRLQAELSGLVVLVLVHHSGKDASKGLRGHSSLYAALDAAIEDTRNGDRREWAIDKAKDGSDGERHAFALKVVEIGKDEDGEPVTSCAVVPDDAPPSARLKLPHGWHAENRLRRARPTAARFATLRQGQCTNRQAMRWNRGGNPRLCRPAYVQG